MEPKRVLDYVEPTIKNRGFQEYNGQSMIIFSYDDGFLNWMKYALPLHEKYNLPATFNMISGRLDRNDGIWMNVEDTKDAARRGIEIASHTHYHNRTPDFPTERQFVDFDLSMKILKKIDPRCETMAMPFNQSHRTCREIAMRTGYTGIRVGQRPEQTPLPFSNTTNANTQEAPYHTFAAESLKNDMSAEHVKTFIDYAVENQSTMCIIKFHDIKPDPSDDQWATTPEILEEILSYTASISNTVLFPVNQRDGHDYAMRSYNN